MDGKLGDEAYFTRTSMNDLIRCYIEAGTKAMAFQGVTGATRPANAAAKKTRAVKKAAPSARAMAAKKGVAAKKTAAPRRAGV